MSLGHPGESYETAVMLQDWLLWAKPDDFDVTIVTVYPGTPLWEQREEAEDHGQKAWRYVKRSQRLEEDGATLYFDDVDYSEEFTSYKGKPGEYVSHVWTPDLSKEDLVTLRDEIEDEARKALGIPYPVRHSGDSVAFDHSMGQR